MSHAEMLAKLVRVHEWLDEELDKSDTPEYEALTEVVVYLVEHPEAVVEPKQP